MWIDYRVLNAITMADAYPMPCIDGLLNSLSGCCFFSKVDAKSAYHCIKVAEHLLRALEILRKANVLLKLCKCFFRASRMSYSGFIMSEWRWIR